jgi:signal transduction histidine kinase
LESSTVEWGVIAARALVALGVIAFAMLNPEIRPVRAAPLTSAVLVLGYTGVLALLMRAGRLREQTIASTLLDTAVVGGGVLWAAWLSGDEWLAQGGAATRAQFHQLEHDIFRPLMAVFVVTTLRLKPIPGLVYVAGAATVFGWASSSLARGAFPVVSVATQFATLALGGTAGALIGAVVQRMRTDLERAAGERAKLISTVAHEIKNPLASVRASLELAREEVEAGRDSAGPILSLATRSVRRLEALAKLLQDLEVVNTPAEVRNEPFSIRRAVRDAVAAAEPVAAERNVRLLARVGEGVTGATGDRAAVDRILDNLISNAMKFSPAGSEVEVRAFLEGARVGVEVSDRGPGIPAEDMARLFERFFRGGTARKMRLPGSGLGLHISQELAKRMRGEITVRSRPGEGASFTLWLDATEPSPMAVEADVEAEAEQAPRPA